MLRRWRATDTVACTSAKSQTTISSAIRPRRVPLPSATRSIAERAATRQEGALARPNLSVSRRSSPLSSPSSPCPPSLLTAVLLPLQLPLRLPPNPIILPLRSPTHQTNRTHNDPNHNGLPLRLLLLRPRLRPNQPKLLGFRRLRTTLRLSTDTTLLHRHRRRTEDATSTGTRERGNLVADRLFLSTTARWSTATGPSFFTACHAIRESQWQGATPSSRRRALYRSARGNGSKAAWI
jgi:hypothetical protein